MNEYKCHGCGQPIDHKGAVMYHRIGENKDISVPFHAYPFTCFDDWEMREMYKDANRRHFWEACEAQALAEMM